MVNTLIEKYIFKFISVTRRAQNVDAGGFMSLQEFKYNWIWAHDFEGDLNDEGWLGINLKFESAPTEQLCLVMWVVYDTSFTIDRFNTVEK